MFGVQQQVTRGKDREPGHGGGGVHGALSPALTLLCTQASPRGSAALRALTSCSLWVTSSCPDFATRPLPAVPAVFLVRRPWMGSEASGRLGFPPGAEPATIGGQGSNFPGKHGRSVQGIGRHFCLAWHLLWGLPPDTGGRCWYHRELEVWGQSWSSL